MRTLDRTRCTERGGVFIEAAFTLPLVFMLSISVAQIGMTLSQYLTLTRVAYEGARYAAGTPGLVAGLSTDQACDPKLKDCSIPSALNKIKERVTKLLAVNHLPTDDVSISTYELEDSDSHGSDGQTRRVLQVLIKVGAPLDKKILPASFLPERLTSKLSSPYLFPDGVK